MVAPLTQDTGVPEYGAIVGSWIVQERIGSGSHGVVFRAVRSDVQDGKSYALKLARQKEDARFDRELWLLSHIHHSSVPRLEGSGWWTSPRGDDYPYIVMEWVHGTSLYARAAQQGLTLRQAIGYLAQVARALQATHRYGVHRDVKGGNILVTPEGRAVLLDFGSGKHKGASSLTDGAMPPGTERYRSPQLIFYRFALKLGAGGEENKGDPPDDVYALGVTAYRLLAGAYPPSPPDFELELPAKPVRLLPPRGLSERCPALAALILSMLEDDPLARGSAKQVAEELEDLLGRSLPALDLPWVESVAQPSTEETEPAPPPPPLPPAPPPPNVPRKQGLSAAPMGVLLVGWLLWMLWPGDGTRREGGCGDGSQSVAEVPDAGTDGLGEGVLGSVEKAEDPAASGPAIARKVPKNPFGGLARPPCSRWGAVEINGGCWRLPNKEAEKSPCYEDLYEHQGRCYSPVIVREPVPTSDDP
jgi:serine/threonine protein kinase